MFTYIVLINKKILLKIKWLVKYTPFKYLTIFILYLLISDAILICTNKANLLIYYYFFIKLFMSSMICYFIPALFIPKYFSIKTALKVLMLFCLFACVYAIIGYFGESFNINFIHKLINTFSNLKVEMCSLDIIKDDITGSIRARGIFHEPGSLGKYILLFSPILYNVCLSKYKIFNNAILNKIVKYSLIPLSIFCVILTKSPIMTIFLSIFFICYFYKTILYYCIKHCRLIVISICCFFAVCTFIGIDNSFLSHTYLYRIVNSLSAFGDIRILIKLEPSLAYRIISYVNSFLLFLKKPFIGYGYDNVRFFYYQQLLVSPLPISPEIAANIKEGISSNAGVTYNRSLLSGLLAETGLIGTFIYFMFLYKNIKYINKLIPYFYGIERNFLEGLKISIIIVIVLSFYLYNFATAYLYLYYGFICSFVTQYYCQRRIGKK